MAEPLLDVELAKWLKAQGYGSLYSDPGPTRSKDIFVGELPDLPDNLILVTENGGGPPVLVISEERSVTITVRNTDYDTGKALIQQISRALHDGQGILTDIQVARITADSNPSYLGRDQSSNRHLFTAIFGFLTKQVLPT